jgi:hypothetical protein
LDKDETKVNQGTYSGKFCVKPGKGNFAGDFSVTTSSADFAILPASIDAF